MKFKVAKILLATCLSLLLWTNALNADEQTPYNGHNSAEMQRQSLNIYAEQLRRMIAEQSDTVKIYSQQLNGEDINDSDILALAEQLIDQLQKWIELDLPFLVNERHARIERLRNMLSSSETDVTEKMRRILEAYTIEAEYGFSFESYRARFTDDDTKVAEFLHVGRNILVYRTPNGRQRGVWDRHTQSWQSLRGSGYRYPFIHALNVANDVIPPEIVLLPVQLTQSDSLPKLGVSKDSANTATPEDSIEMNTEQSETPIQQQQTLEELKQEAADLEQLLKEEKQRVAELQVLYNRRLGAKKELITVIRTTAEELQTMIAESFMPLLLPHYRTDLELLLQNNQILEIAHINTLQTLFMELYAAQAETGFFNTELILKDGTSVESEVTHIGPFTLLHDGKFLHYEPSINRAVVAAKRPNPVLWFSADNITKDLDNSFVRAPVDLSEGVALMTHSASVTSLEHIWQSGWIAYFITLLGIYGLLLVLFRIYMLRKCLYSVNKQRYSSEYDVTNPLGRVLQVGDRTNADIKEIEWRMEQAVLREIPRLEWGFSTIKVLIVVAPLLGLLGTVLGMMETFEAITLYGTDDPKVMAQGISQALLTTTLGLCVAIPLLLLYNWGMILNKEIQNILEEQSAGVLVSHKYMMR